MRPLALALLAACGAPDTDDDVDTDAASDRPLRAAFLADPHIIGDDYQCCESPGLDTDSIYKTRRRLETARDLINGIDPPVDHVFVLGDVFHQAYKWDDVEVYATNGSAPQRAKEIFDGFDAPVHLLWGNHDYDVPEFSREFAHDLQQRMFDTPPYHRVEDRGWQFLLTNSQLGPTWDATDPMNAFLDTGTGSFGREQLAWMAEQLQRGQPTMLMFHHPLLVVQRDEDPDGPWPDVWAVIEAHRDVIEGVWVGHTHTWLDFTSVLDLPYWVVGSVRYDADNFWVHELRDDGTWEIVDQDKVDRATRFAYGADYEDGEVLIDFTAPSEEDPAGPWDGWDPDPWPPAE